MKMDIEEAWRSIVDAGWSCDVGLVTAGPDLNPQHSGMFYVDLWSGGLGVTMPGAHESFYRPTLAEAMGAAVTHATSTPPAPKLRMAFR